MRLRLLRPAAVLVALTLMLVSSACASAPVRTAVTSPVEPPAPQVPRVSSIATASSAVLNLARRSGLTVVLPAESTDETLSLYASSNRRGFDEGILQASRDAGRDLRPYIGQRATIASYPVRELDQHRYPQKLIVVEQAGKIIGAWVVVPELLGGIRELKDGGVSTVP